jgi:hypothetical protein
MALVITKSKLAKELKISRARVSQYVRLGLPVRRDGRLDRQHVLHWIRQNISPEVHPDRGAALAFAETTVKQSEATVISFAHSLKRPYDRGAVLMGSMLAYRLPAVVARVIAICGTPMPSVYSAFGVIALAAATEMMNVMEQFGIEPCARDRNAPIWSYGALREPDWEELAAAAGERVAVRAWDEHQEFLLRRNPELVEIALGKLAAQMEQRKPEET